MRKTIRILAAILSLALIFGIASSTTAVAAPAGIGNYRITAAIGLNVREQPGTNSRVLTAIPFNTVVSVTQTSGEWGRVTHAGRTGWINLNFATRINQVTGIAITSARSSRTTGSTNDTFDFFADTNIAASRVELRFNGNSTVFRMTSSNGGRSWALRGNKLAAGSRTITITAFASNGTSSTRTVSVNVTQPQATTTTQPSGFTPRTTQPPSSDRRYFSNDNPFHRAGFGMPNCTTYAWGRAHEILGRAPTLNTGNARFWFSNNGGFPNANDRYPRGQSPRLGAIAVWNNGTAGHVAVVERVYANGNVDISESSWGGTMFRYRQNVNPRTVYSSFLGFIYII
jgi:surface antigen